MVRFNQATQELAAKIVYFGPACSGKTENLQVIHSKMAPSVKQELISLKTETDRTLFFDYLSVRMGSLREIKVRFNLYSVPGQVFYNEARKIVLKAVDGVVFIADSQQARLEEDIQYLKNMEENLILNDLDPDKLPIVLQYNKRDLKDALDLDVMNERLNWKNLAWFEAVAIQGQGVVETFKHMTRLLFNDLANNHKSYFTRSENIVESRISQETM